MARLPRNQYAGPSPECKTAPVGRGDARPDVPALVLWGSRGKVGAQVDPLRTWRDRLPRAEGAPIDAGHFLVEEAPDDTWAALAAFLERA